MNSKSYLTVLIALLIFLKLVKSVSPKLPRNQPQFLSFDKSKSLGKLNKNAAITFPFVCSPNISLNSAAAHAENSA